MQSSQLETYLHDRLNLIRTEVDIDGTDILTYHDPRIGELEVHIQTEDEAEIVSLISDVSGDIELPGSIDILLRANAAADAGAGAFALTPGKRLQFVTRLLLDGLTEGAMDEAIGEHVSTHAYWEDALQNQPRVAPAPHAVHTPGGGEMMIAL